MKHKILIISGATASGKSALALAICKYINSVIINADSIQLYKELPILSAQPNKQEMSQNEHKLYSVLSHKDKNSLDDWLNMAKKEIDLAFQNNKLPIIVGGTGMYLSKLIDGINEMPQIGDKIREYCNNLFLTSGLEELKQELINLGDDKSKIENLDKQRLLRRLEILKQSGKNIDYWQSLETKKFYDKEQFIHINLNPNRDLLYKNCNDRFSKMLLQGAIKEVKSAIKLNINERNSFNKTLGFDEIKDYILGNISESEMVEIASQKTRNYAKRQLTWFRNQFNDKIEIEDVSQENIDKIINLLD